MHVHSPIFQGQLKFRPITLIVWVLRRVEKNAKKIFFVFVLNKYQSVTHVSTSIFQGLFKNIVFRSVVVTKKLWAISDLFFKDWTFFRPVPNPMH